MNKDKKFLLDEEQLYSKPNLKDKMYDHSQKQNRYNGFLKPYLDEVLRFLNSDDPATHAKPLGEKEWRNLFKQRDDLVQQLFRAFYESLQT